jgi:hypothetical protein
MDLNVSICGPICGRPIQTYLELIWSQHRSVLALVRGANKIKWTHSGWGAIDALRVDGDTDRHIAAGTGKPQPQEKGRQGEKLSLLHDAVVESWSVKDFTFSYIVSCPTFSWTILTHSLVILFVLDCSCSLSSVDFRSFKYQKHTELKKIKLEVLIVYSKLPLYFIC